MIFLKEIIKNFNQKGSQNCFCIDNIFYTYNDFGNIVSSITKLLYQNKKYIKNGRVAVICSDHINTYACLIACWISGYSYIPLGLHNPINRNISILNDADCGLIFTAKKIESESYKEHKVISLNKVEYADLNFTFDFDPKNLAYILFTSGSTGKPKGVPISYGNLEAFLENFSKTKFEILANDKCLQMFELTFDVSVSSFLPALIAGACVYTVSDNGIRFVNVLKIINEHKLTSIQIVPSVIRLGIPLLKKLNFSSVRQCILTGEATSVELLDKWAKVVENASIYNFYGPTECTIYCSFYQLNNNKTKSYNGMLCIGQPFQDTNMIIVDSSLNNVAPFEKGELLIMSPQLTSGYVNNFEKNKESFLLINDKIYYKSGDLCYRDEENDIFYCGRLDNQVKIQGFRIELSEIEYKVKESFGLNNIVVPFTNSLNIAELILVVEQLKTFGKDNMVSKLKSVLPTYMIPKDIIEIEALPVGVSGKTDRNRVKEYVNEYYAK